MLEYTGDLYVFTSWPNALPHSEIEMKISKNEQHNQHMGDATV